MKQLVPFNYADGALAFMSQKTFQSELSTEDLTNLNI